MNYIIIISSVFWHC